MTPVQRIRLGREPDCIEVDDGAEVPVTANDHKGPRQHGVVRRLSPLAVVLLIGGVMACTIDVSTGQAVGVNDADLSSWWRVDLEALRVERCLGLQFAWSMPFEMPDERHEQVHLGRRQIRSAAAICWVHLDGGHQEKWQAFAAALAPFLRRAAVEISADQILRLAIAARDVGFTFGGKAAAASSLPAAAPQETP